MGKRQYKARLTDPTNGEVTTLTAENADRLEELIEEHLGSRYLDETPGSFPQGLAAINQIMVPATGTLRHLTSANLWRGRWLIAYREQGHDHCTEITICQGGKVAAHAFQEARQAKCPVGWIEAYQAVLGGWQLRDRAPQLRFTSVAEGSKEYAWGQDGSAVGAIQPIRPGKWLLQARVSKDEPTLFRDPASVRDAFHSSRTDAIAAANRLAPESHIDSDDPWVQAWPAKVARFRDAGVASTFQFSTQILGPTGVICTAPECEREAFFCEVAGGDDIGTDGRLACALHAGELKARALGQ